MTRNRVFAIVLLLLAFAALAATKAFPFSDELPGVAEAAIAIAGAACGLTGVWLWLRGTPEGP